MKDPPILILDEATAMLDPEGEKGFIHECRQLIAQRTVILITHRPTSLELADRIIKLDRPATGPAFVVNPAKAGIHGPRVEPGVTDTYPRGDEIRHSGQAQRDPESIKSHPNQVNSTPMATTSKRILITGGAGFLGSHLCERLLNEGNEILCVDNFYTSTKQNIDHLLQQSKFEFLRHDVSDPLDVEADQIYNLACPASPIHYQRDPVHTTRTSVHGAMNMLDLAEQTGATILQASTSEVYGDPEVHPQPEEYWGNVNPIGIRSCYDEGKRCAETLFFDYYRQYGTDIKVARIFNTYGPRMLPDDGRVVSNFIMQALQGKDITIYGDGSQTRSFCYVDDLIDGLIRLMNSKDGITGPINLGNPGEFTILELAEKVIAMTKSPSKITFEPLPEDDPTQRQPDITLATNELGWQPKVSLDEGLIPTVAHFRKLVT